MYCINRAHISVKSKKIYFFFVLVCKYSSKIVSCNSLNCILCIGACRRVWVCLRHKFYSNMYLQLTYNDVAQKKYYKSISSSLHLHSAIYNENKPLLCFYFNATTHNSMHIYPRIPSKYSPRMYTNVELRWCTVIFIQIFKPPLFLF